MRMAYADPPYVGKAAKYYRHHPDYGGEVDQIELVERLEAEFPDGWALSISNQSLLPIAKDLPDHVTEEGRVLAWKRPVYRFTNNTRLQWSWEPVLMMGGRQGPHIKGQPAIEDSITCSPEGYTFRPKPEDHVIGAKPDGFSFWLFRCMGLIPEDEFVDLYPGSGAVGKAWERFCITPSLVYAAAANPRPRLGEIRKGKPVVDPNQTSIV